jgi:hypothetical protein
MPRFRAPSVPPEPDSGPPSLETVRRLAAEALAPAHFFVGSGFGLELEHRAAEEMFWEIFHGRLLDRPQTTRRQTFEAWNLYLLTEEGRTAEPLVSLKLDAAAGQLHVTRGLECYVWEPFDRGDNVILSRETRKWCRELVGTIQLAKFGTADDLRDEFLCRIFQAVVGTSRLPLTSSEAPLPQFSLGRVAYFNRPGIGLAEAAAGPVRSYRGLLENMLRPELAWTERAKLLETVLHNVPAEELAETADRFMARWRTLDRKMRDMRMPHPALLGTWRRAVAKGGQATQALEREVITALFRTLFNEVSLSPWTDLVDKTLAFLCALEQEHYLTTADVADFLGHLLRQAARHLTAYDLVTFHHFGANYPDALLVDAVLKDLLARAEREPSLFLDVAGDGEGERKQKRLRRRALRQGWLVRRRYEGHPVPDAPTSQGENVRVLPPPHRRVPEEQIFYPHKRTRRLFAGDALDRHLDEHAGQALRQAARDLHHPRELRELGMALFLDRPLDAGKNPVEPDQTPLLSYLAFSRSLARQRLEQSAQDPRLLPDRAEHETLRRALENDLKVTGLPVSEVGASPRAGSVSLADARKASEDFLFLRITSQSVDALFRLYSFGPLLQRFSLWDLEWGTPLLIVRTPPAGLAIYDQRLHRRVELTFDPSLGYRSRGGVEYPVSPLRVSRVWEEEGDELRERDLSAAPVLLQVMA